MSSFILRGSRPSGLRHGSERRCGINRPREVRVNFGNNGDTNVESASNATTAAVSVTASAAASALLAKVTTLLATAGVAPGAILALHQASVAKPSEKVYRTSTGSQAGLADKVAIAHAPAPAAQAVSQALPPNWHLVSSAAEWIVENRQAAAAGALLATVFISDKAAAAHAPLLERLRRNFGTGADAPVRFVFVHVGPGYELRNRACTAAVGLARSPRGLTLGRLSATAAMYGIDVALTSFLPDGARAFPSLLLTANDAATAPAPAGSAASGSSEGSAAHWVAASRVGELTQLVSDWAFINRRAKVRATEAAAKVPVEPESTGGEELAAVRGTVRVVRGRAARSGPAVTQQRPKQQQQQREANVLVAV